MFRTRPAPPTGRAPPYAFVNRMTKRSLRPIVVLFGVLCAIWALVWASAAFRNISDDHKNLPSFVPFDIVLGVLYSTVAIIEIYGVISAITSRIMLVKIYAWLSLIGALCITAIEIIRIVLDNVFKKELIDGCVNEVKGRTITTTSGSIFNPNISTIASDAEARRICTRAWTSGVWRHVGWLLFAIFISFMFATINFAFYRQLIDPTMLRTQAPSSAYQMNATRNAYGYHDNGNIPGYNPYSTQTYGNYVPPSGPGGPAADVKPPGYTTGPEWEQYEHRSADDEKAGFSGAGALNPFADPGPPSLNAAPGGQGYLPPAGPPPGLEGSRNQGHDEGFDPAALEAAMKASKNDGRGVPAPGEPSGSGDRKSVV